VPERAAEALGWVIFCAAGGGGLLVGAFLRSYVRWPVVAAVASADPTALMHAGADLLVLGARLALPAMLVLALVELAAGLLARFERGATVEPGAEAIARSARPILAMILLAASVAAFTHGVGAAVIGAAGRSAPTP
jgi:type III secretory pathway component EscT